MFLAKGVKSSLQRELDSFFQEVTGTDFNIRQVTKGALTQSRAKLSHTAFVEMLDSCVGTFYDEAPYLVWNNMRVLSVDGSRLALPNHPTVKEEFGVHGFGPKADSPRSLALISLLYDPINLITLDGQIAPYSSSERELLYKHLEKVKKDDLLLLDRGYPSLFLLFLLTAKGIQFCMRMKEDWWLQVKEFKESGSESAIVKFKLPAKDKGKLAEYPEIIDKQVSARLVRVELPNGEVEILCTSLMDEEKFTVEDIAELYHHRWSQEEGYKLLKARMELENFSGKTALAVKQDFFSKIFIMSLCSNLAFPIEEKVKKEFLEEKQNNLHPQKINRTSAVSMTTKICVQLFIKKIVAEALAAFDSIVYKTREIIRPGRRVKRTKKTRRSYYMNYKPL